MTHLRERDVANKNFIVHTLTGVLFILDNNNSYKVHTYDTRNNRKLIIIIIVLTMRFTVERHFKKFGSDTVGLFHFGSASRFLPLFRPILGQGLLRLGSL